MSAMAFREPNEVRWVGVRPAHKGTQIKGSGAASGNTVDVLQISSGKKGFITTIFFSVDRDTADARGSVYHTNSANTVLHTFISRVVRGVYSDMVVMHFNPPYELGSSDKIRVTSEAVGFGSFASAVGWEE
jgi:hypothetical protein